MEQKKKKGGVGRVLLIVAAVIVVLGAAGYFALRGFVQNKMDRINNIGLSATADQRAPDFSLPVTDGSEAKLSELLKEKEVVVLNIFASWCGPCEKEFPEIERIYQKYKDKMEVVAVSGDLTLDDMEDMIKYKEEHGLSFLVGMKNETIDSLKTAGFPTTYIIDRFGRIAFCQAGAFRTGDDFEKIVTSLMGDDYEGKQVALYTFLVADKEKGALPGIQIRLFSDTVDETITTDESGMASYFTENAQDLKAELVNLPDGYTSNAGNIKLGVESGVKMITVEKK